MSPAQIFKALGDPLRLEMVQRLSSGKPHTLSSLSGELGISRQGARKQMQVLLDAGIICLQVRGRETQVSLDTTKLTIAKQFITQLEMQWDARLSALKALLETPH